jgi:hypothetical protein
MLTKSSCFHMQPQLTLFGDQMQTPADLKTCRSGTFVDNMSLPIHRWFRYSAGFAAQWVTEVLTDWAVKRSQIVLDPFVGSGTVPIVCDALGIRSIGVEAHPIVARVCKAKLLWTTQPKRLASFASNVLKNVPGSKEDKSDYPPLILRSYDHIAFQQQIEVMKSDIRWMQSRATESRAEILATDARTFAKCTGRKVDAVITSPPYANNYDYADALRFEMTFWGDVKRWSDIHDRVRKHLMVSSSQHSSRERLTLDDVLKTEAVAPIRDELTSVVLELAKVRESHGGKKHYHTMIAAYCRDIGRVLRQLRLVCRPGAHMCWVIGDSAPYGVYCPIERWIAEMAVAAGFERYHFHKLRDRNIKWKNRKHRVPLKEGLLWIEG